MIQPFGAQLVAGDTWTWSVPFVENYDPTVWTLKFFFRGSGSLDAEATNGDGYQFSISPTDTAKLTKGNCGWAACLVNGTDRVELGRGSVEILPDIQKIEGEFEGRSWVKRMLDAIRANLEGMASREEQEYTVMSGGGGGRTLKLMSRTELLALEGEFSARYRKELVANGQLSPNSNQIRARFC